jgi:hypothetical protein
MEFELFTVHLKADGTIKVLFNPEILDITTEEELAKAMADKMGGLIPITQSILDFIDSKI